MRVRGQGYFCWECWFMRLAPRLHQRYLSWWIDRHRKLGSDETGAKSYDVHAPRRSAQPSVTTDSSPSSSREARHGVAQALVDKVRLGLHDGGSNFSFRFPTELVTRTPHVVLEAEASLEALLVLIGELADRLYASTGSLSAAEAERDATYERLQEARALLTVVYFDRTEWRTNVWFKRVEKVGAGPGDVSE